MKHNITGRVWRFGDNVTTDDILPGQYLDRSNDEVGTFAMAGLDPNFAGEVKSGDIIVAGKNFGMGSGRENAVFAIINSGVAAIVAESFSRIFYRNAVNNGLMPIVVDSTADICGGERITIDIDELRVSAPSDPDGTSIRNLTGTSREILEAGGILEFTRKRMACRTEV
jgi:3-isopropylmalate dehydratase small subunit